MVDHNATIGTILATEKAITAGVGPHRVYAYPLKSGQEDLEAGLIVSLDSNKEVVPHTETADVSIGTGEVAATAETAEVIGAGDGTTTAFAGCLANEGIAPGSVAVTATIGSSPVAVADDGVGKLSGTGVAGLIDYVTGYFHLLFTTAPDNSTNITADYEHSAPARVFSGTLANVPLLPGFVSVTDGVETFTDSGHGRLTGDAGGQGTVDYGAGAIQVSFAAAPAEGADVLVTSSNAIKGVLARKAEADAAGAEVCVHGPVNRKELLVGASAPSAAVLAELDNLNLWPIG